MLAEVRMEAILAELDKEQAVSVAHLCKVTGASEATIRRDLNELARRGKLNKVHGGALPVREEFRAEELDMDTKRRLRTPEKVRIARYAAGLITDDDVVYLDAGSTVMHMVEHIQATTAWSASSACPGGACGPMCWGACSSRAPWPSSAGRPWRG